MARSQAVLIAIGINWEGRRNILAVELASRESLRAGRNCRLACGRFLSCSIPATHLMRIHRSTLPSTHAPWRAERRNFHRIVPPLSAAGIKAAFKNP
jgi:hypothetical protein